MLENSYTKVNSRDLTGHGTHVAGIAAGNFADNKNNNLGIATKSKLVIVKMATATENSFSKNNAANGGNRLYCKNSKRI